MRNQNKNFFSLSLITCLVLTTLLAEEKKVTKLDDVSIIETAFQSHIKSITSKKLQNLQASDIKDILKSIPSVIVDGNARYSQKVYIRGLEDKSSNIRIDGAKISGQLFHHSGDQTIDAEILKIGSIELGANSALSGAGVINGAFIYETKDPSDYLRKNQKFGGKIGTSYQSAYHRKSLDIAVFSRINEKLEFVGIGNLSKDGDISIPKSDNIKTKKSELKSGLIKIIFKPNNENTIKLSYNKYEDGGNRQLAGEKAGDNSATVSEPYNEILRDTYSLNYKYVPNNELINLETKIYLSSQKLEIEGEKNRKAYWLWQRGIEHYADEPTMSFENRAKGIDLRNTSLFDLQKFTYGVSFDNEEQSSKANSLARYTKGPKIGKTVDLSVKGGKTREYSFYAEDEIEYNKFLLTIGARYDVHKLGGVYFGKNKQLSPKFKGEYQATDILKLRIGYGKIFKGPVLGETMMLAYGVSSNTKGIKAQTGNNYELGFDYDLSEILNADSSTYGFTAYRYNVDNYMHPTKNLALKSNNDIKVWGVESVFRYEKNDLVFSLSHTYTDGKVKELATNKKYDYLSSHIHTFKADIDYKLNKEFYFNYNAEFVPGNKIRNSWQKEKANRPGYSVHNISTVYTSSILDGAKINFAIDNLFDKKYARHTTFGTYWGDSGKGSYEVGRNFKIKLSYKF